jgi:hypothetical protein
MQNIIKGIDKATKAGVFSLDEVLDIAKSLETLNGIVRNHYENEAKAQMLSEAQQQVETESKVPAIIDKIPVDDGLKKRESKKQEA